MFASVAHTLSNRGRLQFLIGIAVASIVGGASTAVVLAAIPSSNGTIAACYDSKGALRVIDSEAGNTCTNKEQALSWSAGGSTGSEAPVVKDANGQVLGNLLMTGINDPTNLVTNMTQVFNPSLNRTVSLYYDETLNAMVAGTYAQAYFQSSDCTGQPLMTASLATSIKTSLFRWNNGVTESHVIVADNATSQTAAVSSVAHLMRVGGYGCEPITITDEFYPATNASLPFTTPVATPLKF